MKKIILILIILAVLGGAGFWKREFLEKIMTGDDSSGSSLPTADRLYEVKQISFKIVLREQGNLKAKESQKMKVPNSINRQVTVTWVIDDGTKVKEGDKVAEFDKSELEKSIETQKEELTSQEKKLELAKQKLQLEIEREDIKWTSSEKSHEQTLENKDKYIELEAPQKIADLEVGVQKAQEKVEEARKAVTEAEEKMSDELFVDESQREKNQQSLENKKMQYQTALKQMESTQLQMKIFRRHTYPEKMDSLDEAIQSARMKLEDAKIAAKADIDAAQNSVDQINLKIKQIKDRLKKDEENLEQMTVKAPIDGVVYVGDPDNQWNKIEVGKQLWRGHTVGYIPNVRNFEVSASVPENTRSKVKVDLDASISFPAIPDLVLTGKIKTIAHKAHNIISWDKNSPKAFNITIDVDGNDERLVSGMTAQVEIFVEETKDILAVPVEAVFIEEDKNYVYTQKTGKPEKMFVTTKRSNEKFVEIEGLKEGDDVYLFDPFK